MTGNALLVPQDGPINGEKVKESTNHEGKSAAGKSAIVNITEGKSAAGKSAIVNITEGKSAATKTTAGKSTVVNITEGKSVATKSTAGKSTASKTTVGKVTVVDITEGKSTAVKPNIGKSIPANTTVGNSAANANNNLENNIVKEQKNDLLVLLNEVNIMLIVIVLILFYMCFSYSVISDVNGLIVMNMSNGILILAFIFMSLTSNAFKEKLKAHKFLISLLILIFMASSFVLNLIIETVYVPFIISGLLILAFMNLTYLGNVIVPEGEPLPVVISGSFFFTLILFSMFLEVDCVRINFSYMMCGFLIIALMHISYLGNMKPKGISISFLLSGGLVLVFIYISFTINEFRSTTRSERRGEPLIPAPPIFLNLKEDYFGLYLQPPSSKDQQLITEYVEENSPSTTQNFLKDHLFDNSDVCGSNFRSFSNVPYASWTLSEWFNIKNYTAVPYFSLTSSEYSNMIEKANNTVYIIMNIPQNIFCTEYDEVQRCGLSLLTGSLKQVEKDSNVENLLKLSLFDRSSQKGDNRFFVKMDISNISIFKNSECVSTIPLEKYLPTY